MRALERALDADDDGEANLLADIARTHFQSACAAMTGLFKLEADLAFNAAADAAANEIRPAIGDDENKVIPSPARRKRIDAPTIAARHS